ncbi:response regulator transcription factor [Emticicia agri]|uniref:Response regulator transcription factor n=1 Tax=Emticicia agri TaxID=2492393 RepID=A0A4Q5LWU5_9BACT|nr:response regulator transcription factor [Emticicia agri]RYU94204.1 response regulator transcription factor [Emticicia agri]
MKILLVDDDPSTVRLIRQELEDNGYEVNYAYDGLIAKQLVLRNTYDGIILDIILPGLNGLVLLKELREAGIQTHVLILSALGSADDKIAGFDAGADQYMVKPLHLPEILARIRALTRRASEVLMTAQILRFDGLTLNMDTKQVNRDCKILDLTAMEFKLLEYFLRNQGRVLSKVQIAEKVWDVNFDKGTNYVEVYINYLRKKVDKGFDRKLIHTVFGMGYVLR